MLRPALACLALALAAALAGAWLLRGADPVAPPGAKSVQGRTAEAPTEPGLRGAGAGVARVPGEVDGQAISVVVDTRPLDGRARSVDGAGRAFVLRADAGHGPVLARGVLDAEGLATVPVPASALRPDPDGATAVVAVVEGDGLASCAGRVVRRGVGEDASWRARVALHRGHLLRLRLVHEDGAQLRPALDEVGVRYPLDERRWAELHGNRRGLALVASRVRLSLRPDGEGAFLLSVPPGVTVPELKVTVEGVGTGSVALGSVALVPDAVCERDVVIEATGSIRGRVVNGRGAPIAGLEVVAAWSTDPRPSPFFLEGWAAPDRARRAAVGGPAGEILATSRTDASGRFEMVGLARRPFLVFVPRIARDLHENRWDHVLTVEASEEPEEQLIRLERATIVCEVVGEAGQTVDVELFDGGSIARAPRVALESYGWSTPAQTPIRSGRVDLGDGPSIVRFDVPHGRHYVVSGATLLASSQPEVVTVARAGGLARATIDVASFRTQAKIEVRLVVAEPGPFRPRGSIAVWAEDAATGLPFDEVEAGGAWIDLAPVRLHAPEGRVRVVAEGLIDVAGIHGTLISPRTLGRAETVIDLEAGEPHRVELRLPRPGALEVEVRGAKSPADVAHLEAHLMEIGTGALFEESDEAVAARILMTDTTTGATFPLIRIGPALMDSSAAGNHVLDHWPLGETHTSAGMAAGTFELRATQATRAPLLTTVTIRAGETTRVVVDLGG